ncbi:RVT_3 domain-containing protein [Gossypium australe]|uniref:RVT_3 domain-containing protein n=1 Tax=Gossypium australe TaxID=47621 RepID=A0A5B6V8N0_9ROSI|nr:RVT_3 domain-containing protein [Gossypium australe]
MSTISIKGSSPSCNIKLQEGVLYKKGYFQPLLQCFAPLEAKYVIREIHEGICGDHLGEKLLAQKVLRQRYYWPIVQKETYHMIHTCDA